MRHKALPEQAVEEQADQAGPISGGVLPETNLAIPEPGPQAGDEMKSGSEIDERAADASSPNLETT